MLAHRELDLSQDDYDAFDAEVAAVAHATAASRRHFAELLDELDRLHARLRSPHRLHVRAVRTARHAYYGSVAR